MKKKFLSFVLAICFIIPCALCLSACGNKSKLIVKQGVLTNAENIVSDIKTNLYNNASLGSSTAYSVTEIKEKYSTFNYYVEVGNVEKIDEIKSISFGDIQFKDDQTFNLSIGNANTIVDKCFYKENDNLFIAAPIVYFESVNNKKIKINDNSFDFDLNVTATKDSFTSADFSAGSTNNVVKSEEGYNLTIKDAKTYLKLYFDGANANDVVLTRKVISNSNHAALNGVVNYGLTALENEANYPIGFYPCGYSNNPLTQVWATWYDGASMNYDVYVIGKKVISTKLTYDIVLPTEAE